MSDNSVNIQPNVYSEETPSCSLWSTQPGRTEKLPTVIEEFSTEYPSDIEDAEPNVSSSNSIPDDNDVWESSSSTDTDETEKPAENITDEQTFYDLNTEVSIENSNYRAVILEQQMLLMEHQRRNEALKNECVIDHITPLSDEVIDASVKFLVDKLKEIPRRRAEKCLLRIVDLVYDL